MSKHLVLVGGGHAHMLTLANLHHFTQKGYAVSVIGPSAYHYYSGMGPGMLGKTYNPNDIRFATQKVVEQQGGTFILGKASLIDPENRVLTLESGDQISYDVVSFNAGSYVPRLNLPSNIENVYAVKPIERLLEAQERILSMNATKQITIAILGGGPSAAEIAGNIRQLANLSGQQSPQIHIFAGKRFMARFPEKVRSKVAQSLNERGITIDTSGYVQSVSSGSITLESGQQHVCDLVFLALGVKPNPIFTNSQLPTGPDGGLRVNQYLQSEQYPLIFGGGDCIYFEPQPLDKVGVYAVRQNPILYANLMAALDERPLQAFDPGGDYLLIFNLGNGQGVLQKRWLLMGGKPAFWIKDAIDRRFMRKFQSLEK
jgi:NADH dehydrogenase FAD-containing subunit